MGTLDEVMARLPHLSSDELETVRKQIMICKSLPAAPGKTNGSNQQQDDVAWVIEIIAQTLSDLGVVYTNTTLMRKNANPDFKIKVELLMKFIRKQSNSRIEQRALLRLGIRLLYQHLTSWMTVPIGARTIMWGIDRTQEVFNMHFPGYAANGLLGLVVRQTAKAKQHA